jgi:membrane protease subunit HflK
MPSDQNPWNIGGNGSRRPPNPPQPPWGGGGPGGQLPPEFDQVLATLRRLFQRIFGGGSAGRGIILAAIAIAAIWLATGFYRVEPDEQGLVLRFGAYVRNTPPGLNYHAPWPIESVLLLPVTRINRVEIGFRSAAADEQEVTPTTPEGRTEPVRGLPPRDLAEESLMLTGDENIVDINASVFWRIRDAAAFAFRTRNPGYTVKSAAESVLRQVIGRTNIQSALTGGRAAIEEAVTTGTQAILDQYGTGVEITQVQLQKVDPPADVIEAFRDVQRANTDADTARNNAQSYANDIVPRARGDAAAIVAQAEGAKQAAISAAHGEAQRFLSVYTAYSLAKDVTLKRMYIETMQDVLKNAPAIVVDDKLRGILPLLQLNQSQLAQPASGQPQSDQPPNATAPQGEQK